ncbi:MAG: ABC transporter permease, partial [Panacibacter sp.]
QTISTCFMFKNYFTVALRNLSRNKVYAFINIAGLSIGLACSMLIILYVKDEVSYDRFHKKGDNIYRIVSNNTDSKTKELRKDGNTGYLQGPRFTANIPGIASFVRLQSGRTDLRKGTDVTSIDLLYVDSNFFKVFTFPVLSGNASTCLSEKHAVVLSEDEALKQFGTKDALGKMLMLRDEDNFVPYTVTAITKKCPQNSSIKFNMLLPFVQPANEMQNNENWFNFFLNTFVVLSAGSDAKVTGAKMTKFFTNDSKKAVQSLTEKYGPMFGETEYQLQAFTDMHLSKDLPPQNGLIDASNPAYSYILSGIALFILLIACINFINLTIARSVRRAKEIGIRKVVGGARKQLIIQFLGESFLLCLIAFLFALVLVQASLPVFNELSNKVLSLEYLFDARLVFGYIFLFFITAVLAGFYPALVLSSYSPVQTLYSRFILAGKNYLQKSLVVLQFALAGFLIIATFVMYAQFNFLTTEKLGYDDTNLVTIDKDMLSRTDAITFRNELLKDPDIISVANKNGGSWGTVAKVNGETQIMFTYETVDEPYIPTLKISVIQGRNFSKDFPSDSLNAVLVNESFVKKAGWKTPLGQQVNFWYDDNRKYTVIGVVKDYHYESLNAEIGPELFTMKARNQFGKTFIKIKPNTETASLKHIQASFKKLFPLNPYNYAFVQERNFRNYEAEAKWKQIMLFSAVLTIFVSCIGLFGLSVLSAEKRTKEIGIRKVLGASVKNVVTILSRDFLKLVVIALVFAIPAAWIVANNWLQNYPYRITLSWWLFAGAGVLIIMIALITVSFQAIKAAIANPVKSLRTE